MNSIRTKVTFLTVSMLVIGLSIATLIGAFSIVNDVSRRADQLMYENKRIRKEARKNMRQGNEGKVN